MITAENIKNGINNLPQFYYNTGMPFGIYIEAFILYIVLFFSGVMVSGAAPAEEFPAIAVFVRKLVFTIPAMILVLYLALKTKPALKKLLSLGKIDLFSCLITFPFLLITGFLVTVASIYTGDGSQQITLFSPSTAAGWLILCLYCIAAAYFEESFFRFYLLSKRTELKLNTVQAIAVSTALFAICHIHAGPWGVLNAAISGAFLCLIFLRYNSFHGISAAHALYNIAVYVILSL